MKNGIFFYFIYFLFRCDCGDLKRRDFWDWLLAMGLMLSLGLVSKKLPFCLGLMGPVGPGGSGFGPREKNPFSKRAGSGPRPAGRVRVCKNPT